MVWSNRAGSFPSSKAVGGRSVGAIVAVAVAVAVGVGEVVGVSVGVPVAVAVGVTGCVGVSVGVRVAVAVGVSVTVAAGDVGVAVGVTVSGIGRMRQSPYELSGSVPCSPLEKQTVPVVVGTNVP